MENIQLLFQGTKFFYAYIAIWTWVHFRFQRNFWTPEKTGKTVFTKYGDESNSRIPQKVYYQKAIQLFIFTILLILGVPMIDSFTIACAAYVACLFYFFKLQTYHWLNGLLVLGMIIERIFFYIQSN